MEIIISVTKIISLCVGVVCYDTDQQEANMDDRTQALKEKTLPLIEDLLRQLDPNDAPMIYWLELPRLSGQ